MYALYLSDDGRILHVTAAQYAQISDEEGAVLKEGYVLVESIPEGNVTEYRYVDGELIHDPLPAQEPMPSQLDAIEAQVIYTAMMTDTLLEV